MGRVQGGDTAAFTEIHRRLAPRALRMARAMCRDDERAADVVQDAFLSIWRTRDQYQPLLGDVQGWALTIVRHRALDSYRRSRRHDVRRHDGAEELLARVPGPADVPVDAVATDEARRLHAQLARLPFAQREVIALAYFGELSHTEIAAHLILPLGTVKGRMRLGMDRLRLAQAA